MQIALPQAVLDALREHQARVGWVDEVTSSQDAFLFFDGMGPRLYLTSNGVFLAGPDHDETFQFRESTDEEAVSALLVGAKRTGIAALLNHLPAVPSNSKTCERCRGARWDPLRSVSDEWPIVVCRKCSGFGWSV
jgi:hypothetical protein